VPTRFLALSVGERTDELDALNASISKVLSKGAR
jgi:hypothetical protein